jgi:DhnA family fructose-bisphosphate aldolase class Ia
MLYDREYDREIERFGGDMEEDQMKTSTPALASWISRNLSPERKQLIVAVDHGLSLAKVEGLERPVEVARKLAKSPDVDGLIASCGLLKQTERSGIDISNLVRIVTVDYVGFEKKKGNTKLTAREIVVEPDLAIAIQPHAFKMFLNIYEDVELLMNNVKDVERFVSIGNKNGISTLVEVVFYGNRSFANPRTQDKAFARGCRLAMELGVDAIKIPMIENTKVAAENILAVGLPTFILGGERHGNRDSLILELTRVVMLPVCGIMFGRNVWQAEDLSGTISDIAAVIRPQDSYKSAQRN